MNIKLSSDLGLADDEMILQTVWSWKLIILSYGISWLGSYTTCAIIAHTNTIYSIRPDLSRHSSALSSPQSYSHFESDSSSSTKSAHYHWYLWTGLASVIYGSVSIWALHFLGMLAQSLEPPGPPLLLDPALTLLSAFVAILFTFAAIATTDRPGFLPSYLLKFLHRTSLYSLKISTKLSMNLYKLASLVRPSTSSRAIHKDDDNMIRHSCSSEVPLVELELGPLTPVLLNLATLPDHNSSVNSTSDQRVVESHNECSNSFTSRPTPDKPIRTHFFFEMWNGLRLPIVLRAIMWAVAIALMHHLGVRAIHIPGGRLIIPPGCALLSAAIGLSVCALGCVFMAEMEVNLARQFLCATLMSAGAFGFHYAGVFGSTIVSSSRPVNQQEAPSVLLPMDIALVISALSVGTCLVSIGLLAHTASLSRVRLVELAVTKRRLGRLSLEKEAVDRAAKLKQNFISVASHELRTPLFSVIGYAELLSRSNLNEEQRWYLNNMQQACSNMQLIMANVLDFSKLERNNAESCAKPICVNLREMLEGIAQMTEDRADLAGRRRAVDLIVQVSETVPETALIDKTFVMRICMNLFSNALKFTESGLIMIEVDAATVDSLVIKVSDTGIGIPKSFMSALFEPYRQADSSTTRPHQGTGLGLSICKQLVERLDGTIDVESREGKGTTFIVRIPLTRPTEPPSLVSEIPKHTICLGYQARGTEEKLGEVLRKAGHRTIGLHRDFEVATEYLAKGEVDLVLADIEGLSSSKLLQSWIDRRRCSMGGLISCIEEVEESRWPTIVLTSSTGFDRAKQQDLLLSARNIIKMRRQGIIPHLIFKLLLDPTKYAHEIDANFFEEHSRSEVGREISPRTGSISSTNLSMFDFEPLRQQNIESPDSSYLESHEDPLGVISGPLGIAVEGTQVDRHGNQNDSDSGQRLDEVLKKKILLVDDNPLNVQLGKRLLELLGYCVETAFDGFEAVAKACESKCELILMDCQMPGLDGKEATRMIRGYEKEREKRLETESIQGSVSPHRIPIIALTANVSESDELDCKLSGMDGFLPKPLQTNLLKSTLHTFLG